MQSKIKTIIVDDHEFFRRTLKNYLKSIKNIDLVGEAKNGEEAFALCLELNPLLVIMDINMPVMDGIKACEIIKMGKPEIKVILYSMYDIEILCKNSKNMADLYIPKDKLFEELPVIINSN
ncbi:MAG: response regulator transcription factor [Candidatus Firestonebacteria bacterium]|nr:response regulator transcription factor [Candidatus Firestonebacteria bacterium]